MYQIFKLFPGLIPDIQGPAILKSQRARESIFQRQSHIDRACGQHCLFMALMMFGLMGRDEVVGNWHRTSWALSHVRNRSRSYHFKGTTLRNLKSIVAPFKERLICEHADATDNAIRDFSLMQLQMGRLVVVGLEGRSRYHWTLAIGLAGELIDEQFSPTNFLLLDPDVGMPPGSLWNSTVTLNAVTPRGRNRLVSNSFGEEVRAGFKGALAIGLKTTGRNDHY